MAKLGMGSSGSPRELVTGAVATRTGSVGLAVCGVDCVGVTRKVGIVAGCSGCEAVFSIRDVVAG